MIKINSVVVSTQLHVVITITITIIIAILGLTYLLTFHHTCAVWRISLIIWCRLELIWYLSIDWISGPPYSSVSTAYPYTYTTPHCEWLGVPNRLRRTTVLRLQHPIRDSCQRNTCCSISQRATTLPRCLSVIESTELWVVWVPDHWFDLTPRAQCGQWRRPPRLTLHVGIVTVWFTVVFFWRFNQ